MFAAFIVVVAVLFTSPGVSANSHGRCVVRAPRESKHYRVKSPQPHTYLQSSGLPQNFDWRDVNNTNWLTTSRNQHIPQYCGSCWVMASTSALADRIRIMRQGIAPDFMIAAQSVLHCVPNGCNGGDSDHAYEWIADHGVGPETCQNYAAAGDGMECTAVNRCENCDPDGNCTAVDDYPRFYIEEFGALVGIDQMKAEVLARGPIACQVDAGPIDHWGMGPNRTQIFTGGVGHLTIDHEISVVGWGHDNTVNLDYWIIRNSWGEYWGDNGFFRLEMGNNQLGIETNDCSWAVPLVPSNLMPS